MEHLIIGIFRTYLFLGVLMAVMTSLLVPDVKRMIEDRRPILILVYPVIIVGWGYFLYVGIQDARKENVGKE